MYIRLNVIVIERGGPREGISNGLGGEERIPL